MRESFQCVHEKGRANSTGNILGMHARHTNSCTAVMHNHISNSPIQRLAVPRAREGHWCIRRESCLFNTIACRLEGSAGSVLPTLHVTLWNLSTAATTGSALSLLPFRCRRLVAGITACSVQRRQRSRLSNLYPALSLLRPSRCDVRLRGTRASRQRAEQFGGRRRYQLKATGGGGQRHHWRRRCGPGCCGGSEPCSQ